MRIIILFITAVEIMAGIPAYAGDGNDVKAVGPVALKVSCGDVLIRIDGPMKWTINRVEYKGTPLWIENSACGTVFGFPGIGWIGTGHLVDRKDGAEDVLKLQLWLDGKEMFWLAGKSFSSKELQLCLNGKPLPSAVEVVKAKKFKQHKISRILDFDVNCIIQLQDNRLYEETTISTKRAVPLNVVYNFTHAWTATATAFLSGKDSGEEIVDELKDANDPVNTQYINKDMDWVAIYDGLSGKGVVSRLLAKPPVGGAVSFIRNCPGVYRKFALMSFVKETVPAGFSGTYKMVTGFFEAGKDNWQMSARELAQDLKASIIEANQTPELKTNLLVSPIDDSTVISVNNTKMPGQVFTFRMPEFINTTDGYVIGSNVVWKQNATGTWNFHWDANEQVKRKHLRDFRGSIVIGTDTLDLIITIENPFEQAWPKEDYWLLCFKAADANEFHDPSGQRTFIHQDSKFVSIHDFEGANFKPSTMGSAFFNPLQNSPNRPLRSDARLMAKTASNGKWTIAIASDISSRASWNLNPQTCCMHQNWDGLKLQPGEEKTFHARVYLVTGGTDAIWKRYQQDFGIDRK